VELNYGEEDSERLGNYTLKEENIMVFKKELEELVNNVIELTEYTLSLEDLEDTDLSVSDFSNLAFIITHGVNNRGPNN